MNNTIDYYIYFIKFNLAQAIAILVDTIALLIALKLLFEEVSSNLPNLFNSMTLTILIFLNIVKFLYDLYFLTQTYKEYNNLRYGEMSNLLIDINKLEISAFEKNLGYEKFHISNDQYVMKSSEINKFLRDENIFIEINEQKSKAMKKYIKEHKENLLPFLQWQYRHSKFFGKGFFNEKKLCLAKDIVPQKNTNLHSVLVNKGSYFDTFLTNISSGKEIRSNVDDSIIASAMNLFPKRLKSLDGEIEHLKTITASMMANEIGVSTIGITSDKYMVIWTQNRSAQSSNGLLVPTGSGSCDWSDIQKDNFKETIQNAMQRELWEESGDTLLGENHKVIGETKILGFFRWMNKCGKPEFVGITKLNCDLIGLTANKSEVYNRYDIEVGNSSMLKREIEKILQLNNVSVPLEENLQVILDILDNEMDRQTLIEFIGYES